MENNISVRPPISKTSENPKTCRLVAVVFEATHYIIKLYHHRRCKNKKRTWRDNDYTQRNGRTRFLCYACVSGRKVPFATSGWPDPKDRKGNGLKYYLTVNTTVTDP